MVNPREAVDLDPALEDILSVWGKDQTTQNIEWCFGSAGSQGYEKLPPGEIGVNRFSKGSLEGHLDLAGLHNLDAKGF